LAGLERAGLQPCRKAASSPALAAEDKQISRTTEEPATEAEYPQGLKPGSFATPNGTAEAVPFQDAAFGGVVFLWRWWVLAPLALVGVVIAAPYFLTHGFLVVGLALERGFALVCHQRPERSFWMFGGAVAVCSRCLGIYLGAAVGLLLRTSRELAVRLLIAAAALNLLDAASEVAGLHGNWLGVRFALGFALGVGGALLISSSTQHATDQSS
jgi:uncharacterized membrane protein